MWQRRLFRPGQLRSREKQEGAGARYMPPLIDFLQPGPTSMTSQSYHEIMNPSMVNLLMKSQLSRASHFPSNHINKTVNIWAFLRHFKFKPQHFFIRLGHYPWIQCFHENRVSSLEQNTHGSDPNLSHVASISTLLLVLALFTCLLVARLWYLRD